MLRGLGFGWGFYAALCAVVPLAWGLAAAWILQRGSARRRKNHEARAPGESGTRAEEYQI